MDSFVECCELNHLPLYTAKMKELVVDSRQKNTPTPISIQGLDVVTVQDYKYLDNKLNWAENPEAAELTPSCRGSGH